MTNYPGRPPVGKVLWGASVGDQDPVTRHEEPAGTTMELARLFYRWNHVDSGWAFRDIRENIEAGRHPWVSFKLPGTWLDVASGDYDYQISDMLRVLDLFDTPVWLTMHHEPEGGGGINNADEPSGWAGHRAMNRKVRQLMDEEGTTNIALSLVLMGWTWDPASGRDPDEWWDDCYDFIGIDPYQGTAKTMLDANWFRIMDWAFGKGVDVGVAEWGVKASTYMSELYAYCIDSLKPRVTSLAYFDVPGDWHEGPWVLEGAQLDTFHRIMQANAVPTPVQTFPDVPPGHLFYDDIEWIAAEGITHGHNDGTYRPADYVTRGEMAAFLHRALGDNDE